MIAYHFGTDEIPRQCVTPDDHVFHGGRTYITSTSNTKKRKLYVRNLATEACIIDHMTKVFLGHDGLPAKAGSW